LPDLRRESGRLFVRRVVEDANITDAALAWIESNAAQNRFACRMTAATCASFHPFGVPVETVKANIDHKNIEPERSRKLCLLELYATPQRCFQGE
jgi:hypothetical protein